MLLGLLVVASVGALATPASAHTISGPRPSNYRTRISSVTPDIPGVRMSVVDLGSKLQLTNDTNTDVIVLDAEGANYLKVGPTGVYENLLSTATYLNRTRSGQTTAAGTTWRTIPRGTGTGWPSSNPWFPTIVGARPSRNRATSRHARPEITATG